jgi:hypothetical protein
MWVIKSLQLYIRNELQEFSLKLQSWSMHAHTKLCNPYIGKPQNYSTSSLLGSIRRREFLELGFQEELCSIKLVTMIFFILSLAN